MAKTYRVKDSIWDQIGDPDDVDDAEIIVTYITGKSTDIAFSILFTINIDACLVECSLDVDMLDLLKKGPYSSDTMFTIVAEFIMLDLADLKVAINLAYKSYIDAAAGRALFKLLTRITKPEYLTSFDTAIEVGQRLAFVYRWGQTHSTVRTCQIAADKIDISSARSMLASFLMNTFIRHNAERLNLKHEALSKILVLGETFAEFTVPDPEIEFNVFERVEASRIFEGSFWLEQTIGKLTAQARTARCKAIEEGLLKQVELYIDLLEVNGYLER